MVKLVSFLARLRPWQLFVVTVAPMALAVVLFGPFANPRADLESFRSNFTVMMFVSLPGYLIFYAWVLTVGIVCNREIDAPYRKSERLFRFSVPFAMVYVTIAVWAFPEAVLSDDQVLLRALVFPIHFVATILLFYSIIFSARSLAMLNDPQSPGFWNSFRYFLALLYFPIGLWFVQPKVYSLSNASQDGR